MEMQIKKIMDMRGLSNAALAEKINITKQAVGKMLTAESITTASLERIAAALDVEPWLLLAPPSVVEELKQARATKEAHGVPLVGVVRLGRQTFTANSLDELRAVVRTIEDQAAHADTSNG